MATFDHIVDKDGQQELCKWYFGEWTAETSAADHTIYFPHHVAFFMCWTDTSGASPKMLVKHVGEPNETYELFGTGTGNTSDNNVDMSDSEDDDTAVKITFRSDGRSEVKVDATMLVNSGVNCWVAACKQKSTHYVLS